MAIVITLDDSVKPCYHYDNGALRIIASGGVAPYTYQWSNGDTGDVIYRLMSGVYTVTVTDANGDTAQDTFVLGENPEIVVDFEIIHATNGNNGSIIPHVSGGTAPYTFLWSIMGLPINDPYVKDLYPGQYTVKISDANNCKYVATISILTKEQLDLERHKCCAGKASNNYVRLIKGGERKCADLQIKKLHLMNGYIEDLCNAIPLTKKQSTNVIQEIAATPSPSHTTISIACNDDDVLNLGYFGSYASTLAALQKLEIEINKNLEFKASAWESLSQDELTRNVYFRLYAPCWYQHCITYTVTILDGTNPPITFTNTIGCPDTPECVSDIEQKANALCPCCPVDESPLMRSEITT